MNDVKAKPGRNEVIVKAGDSYNITFDIEDTSKEEIRRLNSETKHMRNMLTDAVIQILLYEAAIFTLTGTKGRDD